MRENIGLSGKREIFWKPRDFYVHLHTNPISAQYAISSSVKRQIFVSSRTLPSLLCPTSASRLWSDRFVNRRTYVWLSSTYEGRIFSRIPSNIRYCRHTYIYIVAIYAKSADLSIKHSLPAHARTELYRGFIFSSNDDIYNALSRFRDLCATPVELLHCSGLWWKTRWNNAARSCLGERQVFND